MYFSAEWGIQVLFVQSGTATMVFVIVTSQLIRSLLVLYYKYTKLL